MADDLDGLGGLNLFPLEPNWERNPASGFKVARYFQSYPGSAQTLEQLTADVPISFTLEFMTPTKEDEYNLLDFYHERLGRLERFWIKYPIQTFVLKEDHNTGASALKCYPNLAENIMRGDERIFIEMHDGDIITKELTEVSYSVGDDATSLALDTSTDRDLTADNGNHWLIGRLLLARFEQDTMKIAAKSNEVSTVGLKFYELVKEYTEI